MASAFPLTALAKELQDNTAVLQTYYEQNGLFSKPTSGQFDCLPVLPADAPEHVQAARKAINEQSARIQQLVLAPNEFLEKHLVQFQHLECLRWLCHFDILSHLPAAAGESVPYATVASAAGVPEGQLKSVARMAMTNNFLAEPRAGEVGHSRVSALFTEEPSFFDWALFMTQTSAPVAARFTDATAKWGEGLSKTQTAYQLAHGTDKPFFDHLAESPETTRRFASYMKNVTASRGTAVEHLVRGFDWGALGAAHVVDVGGSSGHASIALALAHPRLTFTVQDLPGTLAASAPADDGALPAAARGGRVRFVPHDFFTPQPALDADVFLLRMILHDWAAADAAAILRRLVAVLRPSARILIMDTLLPAPGSVPAPREALLRARDLTMLQTFASRERELEDWTALVADVDPALRVASVAQPEGSHLALIEVCWDLPN